MKNTHPFHFLFTLSLVSLLSLTFANTALAAKSDYFVSADFVQNHLDKLKIIDARGYKAYLKGHLPGAIVTDWQSLSNMDGNSGDKQWGTLAENGRLEKQIQKLGITNQDAIVVYSDTPNGWGEEGRIAWSLISAGFSNVKLLDGGYPNWQQKNYSTSLLPALFIKDSDFVINVRDNSLTINTSTLQENYTRITLIDTRTEEEFKGATNYGETRGGHLPGAINIPFNHLLNDDGTLKSGQEIETLMAKAGISKDSDIVTYCTAGIRSAHMLIALKAAGYRNVRNYDQSYYRWAALPYTRVE
ncbi:rhodanese-like domain-containing protein [Endozoicomonas sp. Mp262]|uniref:sulfurtransferase n=1 Tax=Endozoicomonas sp. Mp262 TaxID=2919499 RepID=UPI0021DB2645